LSHLKAGGFTNTQKNVAAAILDQLSAWGVKYIYGVVGDSIVYLLDALSRQSAVKFIQVRHEESAALMASAHAKLTGGIGVCIADGGPGTLHLLNGLADAWADRVPVIAVTGQVARKDIGTNVLQYIDQQTLIRPLAAYTGLLCDPQGLVPAMEKALRAAISENSVAHISVPMDIFPMPCEAGIIPYGPYLGDFPESTEEALDGAIELMSSARRPVILAGAGARQAGSYLADLSLRWGAAIINTLPGTGSAGRELPLYSGALGLAGFPASEKILGQADICLIAGANWWPSKYVPDIPIIQIDRNPAHIGSTTPVSYGLAGDVSSVLAKINSKFKFSPDHSWVDSIRKEIAVCLEMLDREAEGINDRLHPASVIRAVQHTAPDDAIICLDTGDHAIWFGRIFRPCRQRVILSGKWRTMGFGLPAALAAGTVSQDRKVVALTGDGGFSMTMAEFMTAVKYNIPVTVVVFNNGCLATEKNKMLAGGLNPAGTSLHNTDFAAYAVSCGGVGIKVSAVADLETALREAMDCGRPALVDVIVDSIPVPGTVLPG